MTFTLQLQPILLQTLQQPQAFVEGIMEGKEWIWDNGILKESEVAKIHRLASANKQQEMPS